MKLFLCFYMMFFSLFSADLKADSAAFVMPADPIVVLHTNQGDITVRLYPKIAPKASENFIRLTENGYYNHTVFHRLEKDFVIQGGDPTGTGRGGQSIWGARFEDEIDPAVKFNKPFLLAMANSGPKTNGSQFFITLGKPSWLNGKHTIFGEVISGTDVVTKINNIQRKANQPSVPQEPVIILKANLLGTSP